MARKRPKPRIVETDDGETSSVIIPGAGRDESAQSLRLDVPTEVAVLPVRNMVLFPGTVVPLAIAREKSRRLLEAVLPDQKVVAVVCQRDPEQTDPAPEDLYEVGTATMVLKLLRLEEDNQNLIVHGLTRVRFVEWLDTEPYFRARIEVLHDPATVTNETEAIILNARTLAGQIIELTQNIPDEAAAVLQGIDEPGSLADFLAANLPLELPARQEFLEEINPTTRLKKILSELQHQLDVLKLSHKIQDQVKSKISKNQREYFLQEQLKAIQAELGQGDDKSEIEDLRKKVEAAGMPEAVKTEAHRELSRLEKIPTASPEYNVIRTYLDWMSELPWTKTTEDKLDIAAARRVLNRDHYGLEKVKRRILEFLAVRKLAPEARGPILCFVGPPGVGKTSLGQSIARAMGRKFIRMSLGGMRDEAELRGHRRTYIGAMPGRLVQEIRKAGTRNPVFMLDELDKVGADFRGDPTAALLEILDPAQNFSFQDHYLNVPFDLSKVLFIGTANYLAPVPPALRDRMEIIELPGYTRAEKLQIAKRYLVKRQRTDNGLKTAQITWTDAGLNLIIDRYTREAGVRELERQIGSLCRAVAAEIAEGKTRRRRVTKPLIHKALGPERYESELAQRSAVPGVATGLAFTPAGGEIIFIEAAAYDGKGTLSLTGQIGDVMKESAQAAFSLVKSHARKLKLDTERIGHLDIHVHVPAGAVPKDGPSAGLAMYTSLASLLTDQKIQPQVAMTGEITLRGLVLPIGGVKEKVLAARRAGIRDVILPERNRKDLVDVPADVKKDLVFHFVRNVNDALAIALDGTRRTPRKRKRAGSRKKRTAKKK